MPPIRRAGPEAAEEIATLLPAVHDWHAATYPQVFKSEPNLVAVADHVRNLLGQPGAVAFLSGDPAMGYLIALRRDRPDVPFCHPQARLFIDQIAVHPDALRQGHGRALIDAARAHARAAGCAALYLDTWGENHRAHAFFRAMGFAESRILFEAQTT